MHADACMHLFLGQNRRTEVEDDGLGQHAQGRDTTGAGHLLSLFMDSDGWYYGGWKEEEIINYIAGVCLSVRVPARAIPFDVHRRNWLVD